MTVRGNCGDSGARFGFWRTSSGAGGCWSVVSSASIASISFKQVVAQAALLRADLLAALGKPVPPEDRDLVSQLF